MCDGAEAAWQAYQEDPKVRGAVNVALGTAAAIGTVGTSLGATTILGGAAMATGGAIAVDQAVTGAKMIYTNQDQPTIFEQAIQESGLPPEACLAIPMGLPLLEKTLPSVIRPLGQSASKAFSGLESQSPASLAQKASKNPFVKKVGDRYPRNAEYAGKSYPSEKLPHVYVDPKTKARTFLRGSYPDGIAFTQQGFPDFSRYAKAQVKIELTGSRIKDENLCNAAMGWKETPKDYTWHHHQEPGTMQLIPRVLHKKVDHTGGVSVLKSRK